MKLPHFFPVACHTDHVGPGSVFVAINGFNQDGARFITCALKRGARALVVDKNQPVDKELLDLFGVELIRVSNTRKALAKLSASAASFPANHLKCIGITGTKGKTISAWLIAHILKTAGYKTALISTVANYIDDQRFDAPLTTPQPDYLHQFLKLCADAQVEYVVMEVAAQAITMHRVDYIEFEAVLFTNFGLEHLEFYDSLDQYFSAKCALLAKRKAGAPAWLNGDDARLAQLQGENNYLYTMANAPEFVFHIDAPNLLGAYNRYNILGAAKIVQNFNVSDDIIIQACKTFSGVPGRMQMHSLPNGATAIIDYAHNPLSYQALLSHLRTQTDHLIVLFGAGGKRDPSRRPLMGEIASRYADELVLTSDNPRDEDPLGIINDIKSGISVDTHARVHVEVDRKRAIEYAYTRSRSGTVIAILGKGPDEHQIIGNKTFPFSERTILNSLD